jgi:hypothetical protein
MSMNQATTRQVLFVNCKSVDGNLGLSNLKAKAEFKLIFMDNFWSTTLFWPFLPLGITMALISTIKSIIRILYFLG